MKKLVAWDGLQIKSTELERVLQFGFFDSLALEMTNVLILRYHKNKLSFFLSEAALGFLGILFLVPINLLILQKWLLYSNQLQGFIIIIGISIILSLALLLGLNLYLWQQAKQLKSIATTLNKIDDYNRLINNFQLLTKFNTLSTVTTQDNSESSSEITTALQTTKDSLLNSLELEKFVLCNQELQSQDRYQLLNNLEDDLVQLMSLSSQQNETEYQQLLAEAIQIGLTVHQEVRKNMTLSVND
ncbi:conserved hypothetical protein [Hyella patelloides LEGE 07179]|uniref:Uncharacterized protein n=1 Tax=Hyella patelloides LEGE 07179 TaxID=945734 RepID=A0A563VLB8_9CYAN|nr:hypothetical protein [Hyella patelloides]VEP12105.1 conserved hypothetical protein [Hyella patelloides LEGE 07179]